MKELLLQMALVLKTSPQKELLQMALVLKTSPQRALVLKKVPQWALVLKKSPQAQESQQMCCSLQILELELESPEFIRFF